MSLTRQLRKSTSEREFAGEDVASGLIDWLNARSGKPDYERVIRIIKASHGVDYYRSRVENEIRLSRSEKKLARLAAELLSAQLRTYMFLPVYLGESDGRWLVHWFLLGTNRRSLQVAEAGKYKLPWGEGSSIKALIELGSAGYVNRVRQCLCGKWFYARLAPQHSCSATCRQKRFQQSSQYKRKKREYMRNYRRDEKAKDKDARRQVGI
jgi:hypothetical protein